jgi:predicted enzyme related to lactoylglutathione lyase
MTNIAGLKAGSFCWIELATTDQESAKTFYSGLFGWGINDIPMGPDGIYSLFKVNGRDAGAACTLSPEQRAQGVPVNWGLYIAVDDADEAARQVSELGGKVLAGPFDVADLGRMAPVMDPTGASFALWQAKSENASFVAGIEGTFCWADLSTTDPVRASEFYSGLLGWHISAEEKDPSGYLHIKNGDDFIGGVQPSSRRNSNAPPHWLIYLLVSDVTAGASKAKELGGRWMMPPTTMPQVGDMAILADPQGAVFALFKPAPRA